ncbi:MAG: beta-lactamase family protein, partial [Bacteroidales bacterium]|nr:beta-lactamase family protein [Bacteroidales bacterium]
GQIIEKITGKSYETYLREVTAKAGVKDMWVAKTKKADRRENECVYYSQTAGNDGYGNDMNVVGACGAVIASAPDLMQLLCAEDYGTVVPDILKKETLDMMYTNYTSSSPGGYGFGWRIGHSTLTNWASYHGGNISGTATIWARGKNMVNGVLLCNSRSNASGFDTDLYVALNQIMSTVNSTY